MNIYKVEKYILGYWCYYQTISAATRKAALIIAFPPTGKIPLGFRLRQKKGKK